MEFAKYTPNLHKTQTYSIKPHMAETRKGPLILPNTLSHRDLEYAISALKHDNLPVLSINFGLNATLAQLDFFKTLKLLNCYYQGNPNNPSLNHVKEKFEPNITLDRTSDEQIIELSTKEIRRYILFAGKEIPPTIHLGHSTRWIGEHFIDEQFSTSKKSELYKTLSEATKDLDLYLAPTMWWTYTDLLNPQIIENNIELGNRLLLFWEKYYNTPHKVTLRNSGNNNPPYLVESLPQRLITHARRWVN